MTGFVNTADCGAIVRSNWLAAVLCAICSCGFLTPVTADDPQPIALHPDNPRYFLVDGKPTILVTSGEHYGLLLNTAFDFERYFGELQSHGLNHTRVFSGAYREIEGSFGITENTLAPANKYYVCPWQRVDRTHPDGAPIFDLTKWDEAYFSRLKQLLASAAEHEIIVELTLFSPMYKPEMWTANPMCVRNNVNGIGDCESTDVYTLNNPDLLTVQTTLADKLVRELYPFENVYFEICNEPYFGGVTEDWQHHLIDAIRETQQAIGCRKLLSVNVANKTKVVENPHPAISIFNFHYCHPPVVVEQNKHLTGVIGENETGFRGAEDFLYRTEGWDFLVAGGALYNNLDYSFSVSHPDGTLTGYKSPGGGSRALREQLGILKKAIEELPLPDIQPQPAPFITASNKLVASAIGKEGDAWLAYIHVRLPGRLKDEPADSFRQPVTDATVTLNLPAGWFTVSQLDTRTGDRSRLSIAESAGEQPTTISLQSFRTDAALLIERQRHR